MLRLAFQVARLAAFASLSMTICLAQREPNTVAANSLSGKLAWDPASTLVSVRTLLDTDRGDGVLDQAKRQIPSHLSDSQRLCLLGDILYAQAELDMAQRAYQEALESDPRSGRAHWGLGRIHKSRFRRKTALQYFSAAYQLDPDDPEIVLSYAEFTPDRATRKALWRRYLGLPAAQEDPERAGDIGARLEMEERLGDRQTSTLASPYRAYRFKLSNFRSIDGAVSGLLLAVRIDEGKPLKLVVDSGGTGIILNGKFVRKDATRGAPYTAEDYPEVLARSQIGGMGSGAPRDAEIVLARSLAVNDFRLENVPVEVADGEIVTGADGVIGLDVFHEFVVRLDARARLLDLLPLDGPGEKEAHARNLWLGRDRSACLPCEDSSETLTVSHFLLVRATLDGGHDGFFLLDTGSAQSVISSELAFGWRSQNAALRGVQGQLPDVYRIRPVTLKVSGNDWFDPAPVAADLREFGRRQGVRILGTIGYSLLKWSILTVNYRDGVVSLSNRR
jgi:tetratricopeptide (TPR) repeat protein